jgi:endonuclease/exonuclease/phosphatase family metal-dependent hydrolase
MIVYSWNMLFRNPDIDAALAFISKSNFDIFCLQEVPERFLLRLKTLPCSIAISNSTERLFGTGMSRDYNVILSKFPIVQQDEIPFPNYWDALPLRSRIFVRLMRSFHFSKQQNRKALSADIEIGRGKVRVFNIHLYLARPEWRLKDFETALAKSDPSLPMIVCGDFNILESPHISILNWFMGGTLGDAFLHTRERTVMETRFIEYRLDNPLRGQVTHPFSRSQLDHILLSHQLVVKKAEVIPDRYGSDHHPVRVTFDTETA